MTTEHITRKRAVTITRIHLPYGLNWYLLTGLQWYPTYGDFTHAVAGDTGLTAIIGKRKAASAKAREVAA